MNGILVNDIFKLTAIDVGGKKFEGVTRLECRGETFNLQLTLDIYSEVYPVKETDQFRIVLADTLREDNLPDNGEYKPVGDERSRADDFEYVMYGKLYRIEEIDRERWSAFASFGGLVMNIRGNSCDLQNLVEDMSLYLMMKKVSY